MGNNQQTGMEPVGSVRTQRAGVTIEYEIHPAALLFPPMPESELAELAADIRENGLLERIALWDGKILDGRNRLAACKIASIEARFTNLDSEDVPSPVIYVLSKNLHRRQLTPSQRAAIAAEAVPLLANEAKKWQGGRSRYGSPPDGGEPSRGGSYAIAAKEAGVGEGSVSRAARVRREAPQEFEKIKRGEILVTTAHEALPSIQEGKKGDKQSTKPFTPQTKRQIELAEKQKGRMVMALSEIAGICRGLDGLNPAMIVSTLQVEELTEWIDSARRASKSIASFATSLKGAFDVKVSQ